MAEDLVHKEQQAVKRELNRFHDEVWPAFKKTGFTDEGQAFIAYLLMQLVSAAAETTLDPVLVSTVAKPQSAKEALARLIAVGTPKEVVPVG